MFAEYVFTFPLAMHRKGGKTTREMMHSGQGANLKSLFFPVCCYLSWLNKTRRRKREIGFSVNVNILIKANTKHSELLTKKIKLNYEGYANGALPLYDYQDLGILYFLSVLEKSVLQDKVFRNREGKVNNTFPSWWQPEPTKILVQK